MLFFFPAIRVFSTSSSLRLRGDFSLRSQAEDMGKKAQSDSLYRCNTYFTFGFRMPFSMATTVTTTGSSRRLGLLFWKFTWCTIQDWTAVGWTEFRKHHTLQYTEITGDLHDVSGVALSHFTGSSFIHIFHIKRCNSVGLPLPEVYQYTWRFGNGPFMYLYCSLTITVTCFEDLGN